MLAACVGRVNKVPTSERSQANVQRSKSRQPSKAENGRLLVKMMAVSIPPSVHSIIQVVNESNLGKIERCVSTRVYSAKIYNSNVPSNVKFIDFSFLNDTAYREAIENSSNYNTRLCRERRLRMPFLDSQTGEKYFYITF